MAQQARDTSMIMDCGKPMIIKDPCLYRVTTRPVASLLPGALSLRFKLRGVL
jgi:hypothetical protein